MAKALAFAAGLAAITLTSLTGLTGCSPFGGGAFTCTSDEQCRAGGACQPNGLCSKADSNCASGQVYDDHSGDLSGVCVGDEPKPEAGVIDTPPGAACYGTGLVKPCFPTAPTGDVVLTNPLDTDASPLCSTRATDADGFCVIEGETIRVMQRVGVVGTKPLVLVATGTIEIADTLDVASHNGGTPPFTAAQDAAGSDPTTGCATGNLPTAGNSGGGGAGGSFGTAGGNGGDGRGGGSNPGQAGATQSATTLRGGCPGQSGVKGNFGRGGHGGGAVYLIADTAINISGAINASGEGGLNATANNGDTGGGGGGGGGSGGMIGIDSPMIMNSGVVFSNGGSGGEGSGTVSNGTIGPEPTSIMASGPATLGSQIGGDGGAGGAGTAKGSNGGNGTNMGAEGGGGGGGGGVGLIKVYRGTLNGMVSPPPS